MIIKSIDQGQDQHQRGKISQKPKTRIGRFPNPEAGLPKLKLEEDLILQTGLGQDQGIPRPRAKVRRDWQVRQTSPCSRPETRSWCRSTSPPTPSTRAPTRRRTQPRRSISLPAGDP